MANKNGQIKPGIGERLRRVRMALKMSQADFGARIEREGGQISDLEREKSSLLIHTLSLLIKELGVNTHYILFEEGEMFLDKSEQVSDSKGETQENDDLRARIERLEAILGGKGKVDLDSRS